MKAPRLYSAAGKYTPTDEELTLPFITRPVIKIQGTVLFKVTGLVDTYFLAECRDLWKLVGNTGLIINPEYNYSLVLTMNPYTGKTIKVITEERFVPFYFNNTETGYIPFQHQEVIGNGADLDSLKYENVFTGIAGEDLPIIAQKVEEFKDVVFVSYPQFCLESYNIAASLYLAQLIKEKNLVTSEGTFTEEAPKFLIGKYVMNFGQAGTRTDVLVANQLAATGNLLTRSVVTELEKFCWKTDKPLYYTSKR